MSASRRHSVSRPSLSSVVYDAVKIVVHPPCCGYCSALMMQHDTNKGVGRNCGDMMGKFRHRTAGRRNSPPLSLQCSLSPQKLGGWPYNQSGPAACEPCIPRRRPLTVALQVAAPAFSRLL